MSTTAKNGGAAFPRTMTAKSNFTGQPTWKLESTDGMTLRDYFAAQALSALPIHVVDLLAVTDEPASDEVDRATGLPVVPPHIIAERMAVAAYRIADAMLAEREK